MDLWCRPIGKPMAQSSMSSTSSWRAVTIVMAVALIAASCSGGDGPAQDALGRPPVELAYTDGLTIGLVVQSEDRAFTKSLIRGAEEAAYRAEAELVIRNAEGSHQTQLQRVRKLIFDGVDALIVSPVDSEQATVIADVAHGANVPLLAVSNQIGSVEDFGAQYVYPGTVGLIANDDLHIGRIAAGFVQEPVGANIAVLQGDPSAATSNLRLAGFTAALDSLGVNYEIVSRLTGGWESEGAVEACDAFAATGNVDLVYSMSDEMTSSCLSRFEFAGQPDVRFISIGGSSRGRALLAIDSLIGAVCQAPRELGQLAVETMVEAFESGDHDQGLKISLAKELTKNTLSDCREGW